MKKINELAVDNESRFIKNTIKMSNIDEVLRLIKLETQRRGWKGTNLAKAINYSDGWLSKVMKKKIKLSVEALLEIAEALEIEPSRLLSEKEDRAGLIRQEIKSMIQEELKEQNKK